MGNIDSRAQFEGGYLYVKTDRPYYYPGNKVLGKIYIRTTVPMNAKQVEIKVKGKEHASYWRARENDGTTNRARQVKERFKRKILKFKAPCFTFQEPLSPGDFTIPFEFTLPENIPSSMMYKNPNHNNSPSAKIKYSIRALVNTHDNKVLKYKQWLIIHERPVEFIENANTETTVPLTTCCCRG